MHMLPIRHFLARTANAATEVMCFVVTIGICYRARCGQDLLFPKIDCCRLFLAFYGAFGFLYNTLNLVLWTNITSADTVSL